MPVETSVPVREFSQLEFGSVAYEVVAHAFDVHRRYGSMFDEAVYRKGLLHLLDGRAIGEVRVELSHRDFRKDYFLDLLVDSGCPFELKVAERIHATHRKQLIQYLMLTDLRHGKLINFGAGRVEHEFVNCHMTLEDRRRFTVERDSHLCSPSTPFDSFQQSLLELLRDWGTGLERCLYLEAMTFFLGGRDSVRHKVATLWHDKTIGEQTANLLAPGVAFEISCLQKGVDCYEKGLRQFLSSTTLDQILWANVVPGNVRFRLLHPH